MKKLFFLLTFIFISTTLYSQTEPNNPQIVGELKIEVSNAPPRFLGLNAYVSLSSMAFSGKVSEQKVYSNVYTNSTGITQSITGGSHFFYWLDSGPWYIEHIEDGVPTQGMLWIGYGLYKISIGESTFYLDYLDSNYPYGINADIEITYDYSKPFLNRVKVFHDSPRFTIYPNEGQVIRVWEDLLGKGLANPEATDFYLHGTIPIDPN